MHKLQLNEACPLDAIRGEQEGERGRKRGRQTERGGQRDSEGERDRWRLRQAEREKDRQSELPKCQIANCCYACCSLRSAAAAASVSVNVSSAAAVVETCQQQQHGSATGLNVAKNQHNKLRGLKEEAQDWQQLQPGLATLAAAVLAN